MHPLYSYWWSEDKKSLSMCVHVMHARAVQLPLVVMTLGAVPIDVTSLYYSVKSIYSLSCAVTANTCVEMHMYLLYTCIFHAKLDVL